MFNLVVLTSGWRTALLAQVGGLLFLHCRCRKRHFHLKLAWLNSPRNCARWALWVLDTFSLYHWVAHPIKRYAGEWRVDGQSSVPLSAMSTVADQG